MPIQGTSKQGGFSPMDNLTFDLVTILHEKAKALEAYEQYMKDAQGHQDVLQLLQTIRQQDFDHVNKLKDCLTLLLGGQVGGQKGNFGSAKV